MKDLQAGRCAVCGEELIGTIGKGYILGILKHLKACPGLTPEERDEAVGMTLALLELLRRA